MTRKHAERIRVRGTCAAGHVTETTSEKGRVTRTLECSTPGCELEVLCKRIPSTEAPRATGKATTLPSGAKVRRIASYDRSGDSTGAGVETVEPPAGGGTVPNPGEPAPESHDDLRGGAGDLGFDPGRRSGEESQPEWLVPGVL